VVVDVSYADVTATGGGTDYDSAADTANFAAGDTAAQTVTVTITNDSIVEGTETFTASLSTATALGTRSTNFTDTGTGTINDNDHTVTISKVGNGTVTSAPAGINCGATCSAEFDENEVITLTATPDAGWHFIRWEWKDTYDIKER